MPEEQVAREGSGGGNAEPSCRVYVGNLSWRVRWQDLKDHMKQAGEVVRADVFEDFQGKSKGCGIVQYENAEGAQKAIKELTDSELFDRLIFVREDREDEHRLPTGPRGRRGGFRGGTRGGSFGGYGGYRGGRGGYAGGGGGGPPPAGGECAGRQIFVSNLPWRTSWQDLKDLFRECGDVVRADVLTTPDGRSKGVGTVLFASPEGADRAVQMFNEYMLDGRPIVVRIDRVA